MNISKQKKRLIYFQQNLAMGSCEEYLYLLMEGVNKLEFEVIFVCPQGAPLDSLVSMVKALKIEVYRYPMPASCIYLQALFRNLKADIIHFNDFCSKGIISAWFAGSRVLLMTHHTPELDREYNFIGRFMEWIVVNYCRPHIVFTSEFSQDTGVKKDRLPKDKSFVIYYGLSQEKFQRDCIKDQADVRAEFSLGADVRVVANIGRLSEQKGQVYLIEAASLVIEKFKSVRFLFVGSGELELELKKQVQQRGLDDYFIFTGQRSDIPRLLSVVDVLAMPSLFEGLCFAVIEASAMGVPVIASNVGGMRRSVMDGKTGILIPPFDSVALAKAILRLLEYPQEAKEMGIAGQRYFRDYFTQDRMVMATQRLYATLLGG